ncbi:MAG: site-specific integrase [Paenibacillaceae bacterium]|nr:site-specific integrase [Paenibacillaceae bacterium]
MAKKNEPKEIKRRKNELPSGSYRVQVFDYMDENKKKHYKSFTAPTRREAEFLALQWQNNKEESISDITIYDAVSRYIDSKRGVLSPSTVRGYEAVQRNYFSGKFGATRLKKGLDNTAIQVWVSDISKKVSPKTVRNAHGLLSSTLEMFAPDFRIKTTLPAKKKSNLYTPSDEDIKKLLSYIEGKELEIAVLLAAFGPLRRGEICALTSDDISGNIVSVNKSMVLGADKEWYTKQPKTFGSYREVEFPDFVMQRIRGIEGRIVKATPDQITHRFQRAIKSSGLPAFRFHDLRHYAASIMHVIGVPDQYIMQRGGWQTDNVMKSVYRNIIDIESAKQNKKILKHFESITRNITR